MLPQGGTEQSVGIWKGESVFYAGAEVIRQVRGPYPVAHTHTETDKRDKGRRKQQ